jgi:hypothetical protein
LRLGMALPSRPKLWLCLWLTMPAGITDTCLTRSVPTARWEPSQRAARSGRPASQRPSWRSSPTRGSRRQKAGSPAGRGVAKGRAGARPGRRPSLVLSGRARPRECLRPGLRAVHGAWLRREL